MGTKWGAFRSLGDTSRFSDNEIFVTVATRRTVLCAVTLGWACLVMPKKRGGSMTHELGILFTFEGLLIIQIL